MNYKYLFLLLAALASLPAIAGGGEIAQTQVFNGSIRIHTGQCNCGFGLKYYMSFSSVYTEETAQANGELAPLPGGSGFSHWSCLILEDPSLVTSVTIAGLNLPSDTDANGNGIPDFFENAQGASVTTLGQYQSDWGPGTLSAVWSRNPGASQGTMDLSLHDPILGLMGPFHHTFDLLQYSGTLDYTPGASNVSGSIQVTFNQGGAQMNGAAQFVKCLTNRFNLLILREGSWTRAGDLPLTFTNTMITRNPSRPTIYQGVIQSSDGPYGSWTLWIQDPNDWNQNGIPDLSDDLQIATPPRRPTLSLACSATNLLLTIRGDVNHVHLIQEAFSPTSGAWTNAESLMLTSDPQVVSLPLPAGRAKFWRVVAQ